MTLSNWIENDIARNARSSDSSSQQLQNRHRRLDTDVMRGGRLPMISVAERITDPGHGFVDDGGPQGCMRGP